MANSRILTAGDRLSEEYARNLIAVLEDLDKRVVNIVSGAQTARSQYDAAVILNSRGALIEALNASGYIALAEDYISEYQDIPAVVSKAMKGRKLPSPNFSTADAEIFAGLASADLQAFTAIGVQAMDELRLGLYKQAVSGQPFSSLVATIKAATVGVDGKGSPMANHAYTIANTAVLDFGGEVLRVAGENIGAERWEVVGPLDEVTRDVCVAALSDPIRTRAEWQSVDYPVGGTPGGWNCRHQFFPVVSE